MGHLQELYPTTFNKQSYKEIIKGAVPTQENMPMVVPPQQKHQIQNPFEVGQFNGGGLPDVPIQMGGGITEALLGDRDVPDEVKKPFWYVFIKDNILTFLDQDRKEAQMLNFDIVKIDTLNSIPYYDYDFNAELKWNVLRNVYETKMNRSLGFKGQNVKNERILLQSQFTEQRQINEENRTENKGGFMSRLLGRK
jgi:hypothetical protein